MDRFEPFAKRVLALILVLMVVASVVSVGVVAQQTATEQEPNDDRENATRLTFGPTPVEGISEASLSGFENESSPGVFGPGDRDDWYAFDVAAGQAIRAWGSGGVAQDIGGALVGPDGDVIADLSFGGDQYALGTVAEESGTYYVHMRNDTYGGPVTYGLTIQVAEKSRYEPNDDRSSAAPLTPGGRINTTMADSNDTDWYAVDAGDGATINATLRSLTYEAGGPEFAHHVSVDVFDSSGDRISEAVSLPEQYREPTNTTEPFEGTEKAAVAAESVREGTYYIRVTETDDPAVPSIGFTPYSLVVSGEEFTAPTGTPTTAPTETPNDAEALVIVGGSPENKVSYEFAYEGTVERSGESHGAPIEDRHVTVDRDVDEIGDGRIDGRLGGGGDAYLVSGEITGLELDGDADVYLNGERVDPAQFGTVADEETSTPTPTATTTPTATATATPTPAATATPTPTPTPTTTATPTPTATATPITTLTPTAAATAATANERTTNTSGEGRILGGTDTATETSSSSGPGFGVTVAVGALLAAVLVAARRR